MIAEHTLVVVATGTEARMFRTKGGGTALKLIADGSLDPKHPRNDGPAGHRPPESSHQETAEATFAKQLVHHLNADATAGKFEHVIIIADPGTLGEMRISYGKALASRIVKEMHKTLNHQSADEIAKLIISA